MTPRYWAAVVVAATTIPFAANAVDGVLEINQACANSAGCFPGDSPGFPVTITSSGSYRLTSNLSVSDAGVTAIEVLANGVTVDLNGFSLTGPVTCSGFPPSCSPSGTGRGINADLLTRERVTVRNGIISGFAGEAIKLGRYGTVETVTVQANGGIGIYLNADCVVRDSMVRGNAGIGINTSGSCLLQDNQSTRNGGAGAIVRDGSLVRGNSLTYNDREGLACYSNSYPCAYAENLFAGNSSGSVAGSALHAIGGNACADGLCASGRRYYVTTSTYDGSGALTACADGYHMASLWEILDTTSLHYDTSLGLTSGDSGRGPPTTALGWVRTGYSSASIALEGGGNCSAWTLGSSGNFGSTAAPRAVWQTTDPEMGTWTTGAESCSQDRHVWCVSD